jgi:hypothetical protein
MTTTRHEPISQYRIVISHGNGRGETYYCDDRDEAIVMANEIGGWAESYVYGIGWEPIAKVVK